MIFAFFLSAALFIQLHHASESEVRTGDGTRRALQSGDAGTTLLHASGAVEEITSVGRRDLQGDVCDQDMMIGYLQQQDAAIISTCEIAINENSAEADCACWELLNPTWREENFNCYWNSGDYYTLAENYQSECVRIVYNGMGFCANWGGGADVGEHATVEACAQRCVEEFNAIAFAIYLKSWGYSDHFCECVLNQQECQVHSSSNARNYKIGDGWVTETTTTTAIPSAAPSEPLNECYVERLNKDDPNTIEAKLLEVVCLCDDYRSNGFTWALNELSDDLETKVEALLDAGGDLTDSSPKFLKKWKKRMNFAAHLHDTVDVGTVDFFHRRVWRKVCRAIKRPQRFLIKAAQRLDSMGN